MKGCTSGSDSACPLILLDTEHLDVVHSTEPRYRGWKLPVWYRNEGAADLSGNAAHASIERR